MLNSKIKLKATIMKMTVVLIFILILNYCIKYLIKLFKIFSWLFKKKIKLLNYLPWNWYVKELALLTNIYFRFYQNSYSNFQ